MDPITDPFDPEQIKIRTTPILIAQLVSRIGFGEIELTPEFQRLRGIWDIERKSRLVESILLRIPIPVFYVAAKENDNWSVVDGLQRMSTIDDYVNGRFALANLQYLSQLDHLKHDQLPRPMQRRISETQLLVNVIDPGTPDDVMFNVFLGVVALTWLLTTRRSQVRATTPGNWAAATCCRASSPANCAAKKCSRNPQRAANTLTTPAGPGQPLPRKSATVLPRTQQTSEK